MKSEFFELFDGLTRHLRPTELLLATFSGERSEFVRLNRAHVRQAGTVEQRYLTLRLIEARRQASATLALSGTSNDADRARHVLMQLREVVPQLAEDPLLLVSESVHSTADERRSRLPSGRTVAEHVVAAAADVDLAGFYAGGETCRGFANSLGQRNWHAVDTFSLDWSVYHTGDRAVKAGYAGFDWDADVFRHKLGVSIERLALMRNEQRVLEPGEYRAYLAPHALEEITGLLQWNAFSARSRETRQTALLRMTQGEQMSAQITLAENTAGGVAPAFGEDGYVRPERVSLISEGVLGEPLVSARSAREYGLACNGANARESPESLELAGGSLREADVLAALDTGLYVSNLWYLNYSDKPSGRITGMTRFATFWVERGRIVAPVKPMRFDDTLFRMLGENLVDLTQEQELLLSTSTYGERSTDSTRLPGALLAGLRFTL